MPFFFFPEAVKAQVQLPPFEGFLGTNTRREDPTRRLDAVGFVREYHLWDLDETRTWDYCSNYRIFDTNDYRTGEKIYDWLNASPSTTESDFVDYYKRLLDNDREMCITLKGSLRLLNNDYQFCDYTFGNRPPRFDEDGYAIIDPDMSGDDDDCNNETANVDNDCEWVYSNIPYDDPNAYGWYTSYISSLVSFFTNGDYNEFYTNEPEENDPTENVFAGKTLYLENWNEPDKWFCNCPSNLDPEAIPSFSPREYAAMSSANYDATDLDIAGTSFYDDIGFVNAANGGSSSNKFVMAGLLDIDNTTYYNEDGISANRELKIYGPGGYLDGIKDAFEDIRSDDKFVFDVLNFHNYRFSDFGLPRSFGLAPEEEDAHGTGNKTLYEKLNALKSYAENNLGLSNKEFWLSEFGYDTNPFSDGVALPIYTLNLDSEDAIDIGDDIAVPGGESNCETMIQSSNIVTSFDLRDFGNFQDFTPDNGGIVVQPQSKILYLRRFWDELDRKYQREILNVIYETQARWLVRGFMEVRKAEWDKVMQFCLRDEGEFDRPARDQSFPCNVDYNPGRYRFVNSGLLEGRSKAFQPKPSYYYTKTLKEVLSGTNQLTTNEITIQGHTVKIYNFKDSNSNKEVYAVWIPTAKFDEIIEVDYSFENMSMFLPGTTIYSLKTELEAPHETGKRSALGQVFQISDKPIFISADKSYQDPGFNSSVCQGYTSEIEYQTCKHVRIPVNSEAVPGTNEKWDRYMVYYAPFGNVADSNNPLISELTLYDDQIDGRLDEIVVTDFQDAEYKFCEFWHVYIRGVKERNGEIYLSDWCRKKVKSKNCICTVEVDVDMISVANCDDLDAAKSLFDYDGLDLCDLDNNANQQFLAGQSSWISFTCDGTPEMPLEPVQTFTVPFKNGSQQIDAVYLYDENDNDIFKIDGIDASGNLYPLVEYDTRGNEEWVSFANFPEGYTYGTVSTPVSFTGIRVTRNSSNARIKKIVFVCHSGELSSSDDQLADPSNPTESAEAYEENVITQVTITDTPNNDKELEWTNPYYSSLNTDPNNKVRYLVSLSNEYDDINNELINPKQFEIEKPITEETSTMIVSSETEGIDFRREVHARVEFDCFCKIKKEGDEPTFPYTVPDPGTNEQDEKLSKQSNTDDIFLYPVPAAAKLKIEINIEGVQALDIFDLNGKYLKSAPRFSGKGTSIVDVSTLPAGVYLLRVKVGDGRVILKRFVTIEE